MTERNEQVQIMGQIYSNADMVEARLSEGTTASEIVLDKLCQFDDSAAESKALYMTHEVEPDGRLHESIQAQLLATAAKRGTDAIFISPREYVYKQCHQIPGSEGPGSYKRPL